MWKVAVVQPVTEGFGFNITTEANLPLVSFAYKTRAEAETAATHASSGSRESRFGASNLQPAELGANGGPSYWIGGTDEWCATSDSITNLPCHQRGSMHAARIFD